MTCRIGSPVPNGTVKSVTRTRPDAALTIIELLIVITVIAILIALLMPAINMVRLRAMRTEAKQFTGQLTISLETYANEDRRHYYPLQGQLYPTPTITVPQPFSTKAQGGAAAGLLNLLRAVGVNSGPRLLESGNMLDPWGSPYCYQLTRPAPTTAADLLLDWNWDKELNRPKRWNERTSSPASFPYVWSLGQAGSATDATTWIYEPKS